MALTPNDVVKGRLNAAFEEYQPQAAKYEQACARFRDSSMEARDDFNDPDNPASDDRAQGEIAHLRTNIQVKTDSIAIGDPDWHLVMQDGMEQLADIARQGCSKAWESCNLTRHTKRVDLNRNINGLGILAFLHDPERGPTFEHVKRSDFAPDPHCTDYKRLRYAGRKIRMARDEARKKYPEYRSMFDGADSGAQNAAADARKRSAVELKLYWDATTEAVMYGSTLIDKGKNPYDRIPMLFLQGDLQPDSVEDTGDMDNAYQMQTQLSANVQAINNHIRDGGPLNLVNLALLGGKRGKQWLQEGRENGFMNVEGGNFAKALTRIPAEELSPALMQGTIMQRQAIDEAVGVTASQRGAPSDANFATEIVTQNNLAGARTEQNRQDYELFLADVMKTLLFLITDFETPKGMEQYLLFQAFAAIQQIRVVERSTSYKDPAAERQDAVLLFNLGLQGAGVGLPLNLQLMFEDVLRSFGRRDPKRYFVTPPPQQGAGTPVPGQLSAGAPPSTGGAPAQPLPPGQ